MKFEINKTSQGRSIGDADCKINMEVISRTAKTIKAKTDRGLQTFRVFIDYSGNECVKPWGSYSMAPQISAEKVIG